MRVCMLLDRTFPPDPRVANEARSLVAAGHEVTVLCLRHGRDVAERETWEGIRLRRFLIGRGTYRKTSALSLDLPYYRRFLRRMIEAHLEGETADAVHAHDLPTAAVAAAAARKHRASFVADLHENWPAALRMYGYAQRFPGKLLISPDRWAAHEKKILPVADRIIVVIEESKARIERLGIPGDRVAVVKNTVHVDEFEGFPEDPAVAERYRGRFVLIYLGGFERHRGIEMVIDAVPELARAVPDVLLVLVGGGASDSVLRRRAADRRVSDHIVFEGWQPFSRFPSYIRASDVALIPHVKTEHTDTTIPHKLFHYMLLERPVLTTDCDPIARIVRETESGLVVPSGDSAAFARAALTLRDPSLRKRMGAAGRAAVMNRYRWDRDAATLVDLYAGLDAERRNRPRT